MEGKGVDGRERGRWKGKGVVEGERGKNDEIGGGGR